MWLRKYARSFGWCAVVALAGCGGSGPAGGTVSGKVTKGGAPVAGAKVEFYQANSPTASFAATTDDAGTFKLGSGQPAWRAKPGSYKVTVTKFVPTKGAKLPEGADPEQIEASGLGVSALPKDYANPATTPLTATINEGPNDLNLEVKEK